MRRISTLSTAVAVVLLSVLAVGAQRQEPRRPASPMLTNDGVSSPGAAHSLPEESVTPTNLSGSPVRNPRAVLESAITKMGEVNSVRTRVQGTLPEGEREILIESMKPDRLHVISPFGEVIAIGNKLYVKNTGRWEVTTLPSASAQSQAGFDFRAMMKQMLAKSSVRMTGQILGSQMIDGVDTLAYEFALTEGSDTGTIQVSVGKADGYMRRMSVSGGGVSFRIWFTNINEQFSIEPPM
jgi:hypothetical protein